MVVGVCGKNVKRFKHPTRFKHWTCDSTMTRSASWEFISKFRHTCEGQALRSKSCIITLLFLLKKVHTDSVHIHNAPEGTRCTLPLIIRRRITHIMVILCLGEDVLVHILSFLEPPDILQLAQVSTVLKKDE